MNLLLTLNKENSEYVKEIESRQPLKICFNYHGVRINIYTNSEYMVDHLRLGYNYFETDDTASRDLEQIIFLRDNPLLAFYTVKLIFGQVITSILCLFSWTIP